MTLIKRDDFKKNWKEIVSGFLKLGATAYGGPAIYGILQTELQEKRQWVSKERFVEGVSLANLIPGATMTQLCMFLGYARGGFWGGLLAGLCFVLPAFGIMLALTLTYAYLGATPIMRGGLYGLGPVVVGIFVVAVYRLSRSEVSTLRQMMIALTAAAAVAFSPVGVASTLALGAGVGILLFHSLRAGALILALMTAFLVGANFGPWISLSLIAPTAQATAPAQAAGLTEIAAFFSKIGALTFGGGLTIIALIQEQAVDQYHWLTHQEFIDGLALGQFTPGPMIIVAAYVGYKIAGLSGAALAAAAIFLPSFVITLPILPIFERVRKLVWTTAAMKGIGPAVMGILAVKLFQMAPHALPDPFAVAILIATVIALLASPIGAVKLMVAGSVLGILRSRLFSLPGVKAAFCTALRTTV
jgi:chromate transporter